MGIAVLAGALGAMLTEFGVVALINKLLSPLMGVLYGCLALPPLESSQLTCLTILPFWPWQTIPACRYFKRYQLPALTNLGTAFGMGAVITASCWACS